MDEWREIEARAQCSAPDARVEPSHAALQGAAIALFGCLIFIGVAGLYERGRVEIACLVVIALGGIGPYVHFRLQRKAYIAEIVRLQLEARERAVGEAQRTGASGERSA